VEVQKLVVKPGEGRSVWLGGMGVVFKVSGAETRGAFAVVEHPIDPGRSFCHTSTCMRMNIPTCWKGRSVRGSAITRSSRDRAVT
jgi:hypothetical protein